MAGRFLKNLSAVFFVLLLVFGYSIQRVFESTKVSGKFKYRTAGGKKMQKKEETNDIKRRAKELVEQMSLEEKFGQIVCIWPKPDMEPEEVLKDYPEGVGFVSATNFRTIETPQEVADLQRKWQRAIMEKSPHRIPAIFHTEGLCGALFADADSFPTGIGRASSWDEKLERKIGEIVSRQSAALGFTHVLAPVLDISRDPRNGRQGETYGEDPTLAAAMGTAYTEGIQETSANGLYAEAVAKHFVGFHGSIGGVQSAHFETGIRQLKEIYCKPFQAAITNAGLKGVMPCYSAINGKFPTASEELLTMTLRDEMGFDGLAVSDYNAVFGLHHGGRLFESKEETGWECIKAGLDVEMPQKDFFGEELMERFRSGRAPEEVLDRAVQRVLEAKLRMGLPKQPFAAGREKIQMLLHMDGDREVGQKAARESLVLLKNNGALPLEKHPGKIALIGPHANTARAFFGGYTYYSMAAGSMVRKKEQEALAEGRTLETYPGSKVIDSEKNPEYEAFLHRVIPECKSLREVLEERFGKDQIVYAKGYQVAGTDTSGFEEALQAASDADLVILTLGGKYGTRKTATMAEGVDAVNINLPQCQEEFLTRLRKLGKTSIGIHLDGRPISSDAAQETLDALIEAWSPSQWGAEAIVDVLTGSYNPSGKVPVSVAYTAGQIPIYYNMPNASAFLQAGSIGFADYADCPHRARYPFGYGLSYTTFAYDDLRLIQESDHVKISFTVENTGQRAGTEIIQLYFSDLYASRLRPGKELAGFAGSIWNREKKGRSLFQWITVRPRSLTVRCTGRQRQENWKC